jgi:hypothetical protein
MTSLTRPVSDLDLGIDIGVRCGLDMLGRELAAEEAAVDLDRDPDGLATAHVYAAGLLRELRVELAGRFQ